MTSTSTDIDTFLHQDLNELSSFDDDVPRIMSREVSRFSEDFGEEYVLGWVDSCLAAESTNPKPASSSALAAVSGDVCALEETRQLYATSYNDCQLDEPAERDMPMAPEDIQPSAPSPALPASPAHGEDHARPERRNAYNSREQKINRELLALSQEGRVELWFGERGIAGEHCISAIQSSQWSNVIDRLNCSINSTSSKHGTPSENLTQCLRDCGVVPRKKEGRSKKSWREPMGGMWEFSVEAWEDRQDRLSHQYAGTKRKRTEEDVAEEAGKSSRPAARKRSSRRSPPSPVSVIPVASLPLCSGVDMPEQHIPLGEEWMLGEEAELLSFSRPLSPLPIFEAETGSGM